MSPKRPGRKTRSFSFGGERRSRYRASTDTTQFDPALLHSGDSSHRRTLIAFPTVRQDEGAKIMKKLLVGVLGVVSMATSASAADLPMKARPVAVSPAYNWSGF